MKNKSKSLKDFVNKDGHINDGFKDIFIAFLQGEVFDFIILFLEYLKDKYNKEILDIKNKIDKLDNEKINNILMFNLSKISSIDEILDYFYTWKKDLINFVLKENDKEE